MSTSESTFGAVLDRQVSSDEQRETKRVVLAASAGSLIEWFEFSVYGYLAGVMGAVFFASSSPSMQVIASLATFAIAFLARPFGGIVCGALGDRYGRKVVLNLTLFVMAGATFAIGLIPSYETIGVAAPLLLILMRLLQGLSAGGELSAAAIYVAEHCSDRRRSFMTSWVEVGCISGFFLGAIISFSLYQFFDDQQLHDWAWRIPFFLAAPMALIGLYIRRKLEESPLFTEARNDGRVGKLSLVGQLRALKGYSREMFQAAGMVIVSNVTLFTVLTYIPTYLKSTLKLSGSESLALSIAPMLVLIVLIPILGLLADRVGRKRMMVLACVSVIVLAIPCFMAIGRGGLPVQLGALILLNACLAMLLACILAQVPSLFPLKIRFMAMAFSYNISVALFAGTAPVINAWLVEVTGNPLIPAYYLMAGGMLGLLGLWRCVDRTGKPMP